jgi:hypothetical protein
MANRETALQETFLPTFYADCYGRKGLTIYDLAKQIVNDDLQLTFDVNYLKRGYVKSRPEETPFYEIRNMDIMEKVPSKYGYLTRKQEFLNRNLDDTAKLLKQAIKNYIVKLWNTDKKKVMLHSAGHDSRIISGILMELREEKGEDWIGELHFRCHQPEGDMFKIIMEREGWKPSQYSLWEDFKGKDDHYNLGRIEPVNGFLSHIQQYDFFSDIVDEDTILIGGIYGGEMFSYPALNKKHFTNHNYTENEQLNSLLNYMLYDGETISKYMNDSYYMIAPYISYEYLSVACRVDPKHITYDNNLEKGAPDNIRLALLKTFDVDLVNIPYCWHDYTWNTTDKRWQEMKEFYYDSAFFHEYDISIQIPFKGNTYESKIWAWSVVWEYIYGEL